MNALDGLRCISTVWVVLGHTAHDQLCHWRWRVSVRRQALPSGHRGRASLGARLEPAARRWQGDGLPLPARAGRLLRSRHLLLAQRAAQHALAPEADAQHGRQVVQV
eukprot:7380591-Prymnesium_polylepis.2